MRVEGDLAPATEAADRAAAALAGSTHAAEWSWLSGTRRLRVVAPRARTAAADLFGVLAGNAERHPYAEEARSGTADADDPAVITLETV